MDIKKTGHTCETSPEACAQPYLPPDTTLALFWMGRGAAILSSAQMTAEDLVFAVRGLGEAQAAYMKESNFDRMWSIRKIASNRDYIAAGLKKCGQPYFFSLLTENCTNADSANKETVHL